MKMPTLREVYSRAKKKISEAIDIYEAYLDLDRFSKPDWEYYKDKRAQAHAPASPGGIASRMKHPDEFKGQHDEPTGFKKDSEPAKIELPRSTNLDNIKGKSENMYKVKFDLAGDSRGTVIISGRRGDILNWILNVFNKNMTREDAEELIDSYKE